MPSIDYGTAAHLKPHRCPGPGLRRWRTLAYLAWYLVFLVSSRPVHAGDEANSTPPWAWSLNERLRERFDPSQIERRNAGAALAGDLAFGAAVRDGEYVIDGRVTPAIFLPWELFDQLIHIAFTASPDIRDVFREQIEANLTSIQLPSGFWQELEVMVGDLAASEASQVEMLHQASAAAPARRDELMSQVRALKKSTNGCLLRHIALKTAQQTFGEDFFLQFLYEGVAPETTLKGLGDSDRSAELLFVQGGCR